MLVIRPVTPADFEQLLSLFEIVAAERMWIGTEPGFDKAAYRARWQDIVDGKGGAHFLASVDGALVGALSIYVTPGDHYDLGMLVAPESRRRGIGTALLQIAFNWAQERGVTRLSLGVFPHNTAAADLYLKAGFVQVGEVGQRKRQTGDVWSVILMEKQIAP